MSEKYYGNYLGIVVTSAAEDPERRNRVQVWIPSISNTLYKNWNNDNNDKVFFNLNSQDFLQRNVLDSIRNSLPWAECASPLIGGGSAFYTNTNTGSYSPDPAETIVNPDLENNSENVDGIDLSLVPDIPLEPDTTEYPSTTTPTSPSISTTGEPLTPAESQSPAESLPISNDQASTPNSNSAIDSNGFLNVSGVNSISVSNQISNNFGKNRGNYNWFNGIIVHDDGSGGRSTLPGLISWANQSNLGYTAYIDQNGKWIQTKPFNYQTSHAGTGNITGVGNRNTIGVMLIGVDERVGRNPTQAQLDTLSLASAALGIRGIGGHGEFTTRKVATEGLLASEYVRNKLGLGDLTALSDGDSSIDRIASQQSSPVPYPNYFGGANAASPPSTFDGTATGTFSTLNVGAKVWVFFYGGDVQKPVYFAQSLDPASNAEAFQNPQT